MKKNKTMRLASVLLILTLLTTSVISGTFAKYTSTVSGKDTATVAKWSFTQNGTELIVAGTPETVAFNLFDTIVDTATGAADEEVAANLIAPGTKGQFKIAITNSSEVDATFSVALAENVNNIPLQFSLDGSNWKNNIADLPISGTLEIGSGLSETVYWQWIFNGNDGVDTAAGIAAQTSDNEVEITATITFTQVD